MVSQVRRGHHHEFDGSMSGRLINGHGEDWKSSDRINSTVINNILPDVYPSPRSTSNVFTPDLSRAFRVDAYLLAIIRIEDKRNSFYSTEVVSKLRQKEQTQSFINKPCSLFVTDRSLVIYDRGAQVIAETVPLENVDPTCVYSEVADTLNDIFMYRLFDRHFGSTISQSSHSRQPESTSVIVFKCTNKESRLLVETIRNTTGKTYKNPRSARSEPRSTIDRRITDTGRMSFYDPQQPPIQPPPPLSTHDQSTINRTNPPHAVNSQYTPRTVTSQQQQQSAAISAEHYKRLTDELNKCFDDIELFVRYLESLTEYTKDLERDHRRKDKKSTSGLKQMVEKIPEDRFFIDVLQKFKHSFNLLGELKYIIHNPNAPELIHYLLSPLQFILNTLRTKHVNQLQIAQEIWRPSLTKEAGDLLMNCLTSKEQEILRNLGPAWMRIADESPQKFNDYRPTFFEGHPSWFQDATTERQPTNWSNNRQPNENNGTMLRQASPGRQFDTSTIDRSVKNGSSDNYNSQMQNEHAWAIERKRAGARICAVKVDRKGQNNKELTVRCGELIEIENSSKKWWRARNFRGEVGHVPHNIVEEIEIEQRPTKSNSSNPSAYIARPSSAPIRGFTNVNGYHQRSVEQYPDYLFRSPSHENFILQSNHSSTTNPRIPRDHSFHQIYSASVSSPTSSTVPPPAPPPPPPAAPTIPPPPPLPAHFLTTRSASWSTLQLPDSSRSQRSRANTNLSTSKVDELQQELAQRLTDRVGLINQNSTKDDVQRWLASKNISPGLAQNLNGMNGEELFRLTKDTLLQFTNETEANKLHNLLYQQKKLAGYHSDDTSERSIALNSAISSLKASTINDADDNFSFRINDSLTRSLKIKLKKQRDKIEQAETFERIEL